MPYTVIGISDLINGSKVSLYKRTAFISTPNLHTNSEDPLGPIDITFGTKGMRGGGVLSISYFEANFWRTLMS
jgi:predicted RNA binding protein with dsRBD fold (UPF0201 family)